MLRLVGRGLRAGGSLEPPFCPTKKFVHSLAKLVGENSN